MILILWMIKLIVWSFIALVVIFGGLCFLGFLGFIWEIVDAIRGKK